MVDKIYMALKVLFLVVFVIGVFFSINKFGLRYAGINELRALESRVELLEAKY